MKKSSGVFSFFRKQKNSDESTSDGEKDPSSRSGLLGFHPDLIAQVILHPAQTLDGILQQKGERGWLTPLAAVAITIFFAALISAATTVSSASTGAAAQSSVRQNSILGNAGNMGMDMGGGAQGGGAMAGGGGMPGGGAMPGGQSSGGTSSSGSQRTNTQRAGTSATATPSGAAAAGGPASTTASSGTVLISSLIAVAGFFLSLSILTLLMNVLGLAAGGRSHSAASFLMTAWSFIPIGVRNLVRILYFLVTGKGVTRPGLSGFLTNTDGDGVTAFFQSLLSNVDVYLVWQIVLLVVGVGLAARITRSKSVLVVLFSVVALLALQALLAAGTTLLGNLDIGSSLTLIR